MRFLAAGIVMMVAFSAWAADSQADAPAQAEPSQRQARSVNSPVDPLESLKHFELEPGLRMELVAAEPEVVDPVALQFDEDGRLWVAEYRDYPLGPPEGEPPLSRIRLLEDLDGDGRFETSHVFAEKIPFCNGLQPWKGGVFVTSFGRILYLKDTTGNHQADLIEEWFTGFSTDNSQLFVNHPRFALDNHIYVANGLRGGEALSKKHPDAEPLSMRGFDLRFDPFTGRAETVSGNGQFGLNFDEFNNRFICSNRNPLMHVVLENRYLKRNPNLAVSDFKHDVAASGEQSRIFPLIEAWTTSILHAGQYTAACGVDIYRGDALPAEYYGNGFTCEPTGSLVHREILTPAGATFSSRPSREGAEFLASHDPWVKPVYVHTGPDGALYVVDMYRKVIEHPQFMPVELKTRPDLRDGDDRGRIYRVVSANGRRQSSRPRLSQAASADLVAQLEHPNGWWRVTAHRLLMERQDKSVQKALERMVRSGGHPAARVRALWVLEGLGQLSESTLRAALEDQHPRVREQAVVLAERRLESLPSLIEPIVALAGDADGRLRFQVALTLGEVRDQDMTAPLAQVALAGADDPWTRRAVATAVPDRPAPLLAAVLAADDKPATGKGRRALVEELAVLVGSRRDADELALVLGALAEMPKQPASEPVQLAALGGLARGLQGRGASLAETAARLPDGQKVARDEAARLFLQAARLASDEAQEESVRLDACQLLSYADFAVAEPVLTPLVQAAPSQTLRLKAIAAMSNHRDPGVGPILLETLSRQTPVVRGAILDAMLARNDRAALVLDEIEAGRMKATALDTVRAGRLTKSRDQAIRTRAEKLLASTVPADREQVLAEYQSVLNLKGDAAQGREIFRKNCSTCHKIAGIGYDVGPSIADLRTKTPAQILVDVLQPNRAIDNNFISYTVVTVDGRAITGVILAETDVSVTVREPEGKETSLLKTDIEEMISNGVSLMPDGLERNIPPQQMADVIAFVKNWRYLDRDIPVGQAAATPSQE